MSDSHSIALEAGRLALAGELERVMPGSLPLAGRSKALDPVDRFIRRAAQVDLPVWVRGEVGTEKDFVAFSTHAEGPRRFGPFVPVRCGMLVDGRSNAARFSRPIRDAAGGTVFLRDVDALSPALQRQLLAHVEAGSGRVRFVASSTDDLYGLACSGGFSRPLVEALCCLALVLPPLRERKEDIEPLVRWLVARQSPRERRFSGELISYLEDYPWPGNLSELARMVTRLTLLSDEETLTLDDLHRYAPELAQGRETPTVFAAQEGSFDSLGDRWSLADRLLEGDTALFSDLHPAVQRAATYLAGHYQGSVSLGAAARHACLTPSHLSVLFHKSLGCTFRDLLCTLRVQKSRQLLLARPQLSVTEICFEVGFSDLSTFERCFKRLVGCGPRDYRRRCAGPSEQRPSGISGRSALPPSAFQKPSH